MDGREPESEEQVRVVEAYQERHDRQDMEACLALVADGAIFDVGRGHFVGREQIRHFLNTVTFPIHTETEELEVLAREGQRIQLLLSLSDDNTRRFDLGPVQVQAEYTVREGRIVALHARPTAEAMEKVRVIQRALAGDASRRR